MCRTHTPGFKGRFVGGVNGFIIKGGGEEGGYDEGSRDLFT